MLLIIGSIVLWFSAGPLAGRLIPRHSGEANAFGQLKDAEGFVLAVVGLILSIHAFTSLLGTVLNVASLNDQGVHFDRTGYISSSVADAVRLAIGLSLVIRAEGYALLLRKIRGAGLQRRERE